MTQNQFNKSFKGNNSNIPAMSNDDIIKNYKILLNDFFERDHISKSQLEKWRPVKFLK